MSLGIAAAMLASWAAVALDASSLTLVQDGRPASLIVINAREKDGYRLAATELQEHLRIMSGATLPIVNEDQLPADPPRLLVLVGPSRLAKLRGVDTEKLERETFVVKTTDDALILAGDDGGSKSAPRTGSLWAVYDFLQDQLGCRWIWPGEIGRVIPRRTTVTVAVGIDIHETPKIKIRGFRTTNQEKHRVGYEKEGLGRWLDLGPVYRQLAEDEQTWLRRMRMGDSFKLSYGHAFTDWWEKYKDSEPEIFALQPNGRRGPRKADRPDFVKMCVSNPRLWELQLEPLKKAVAQGARELWLNSCENDGSGGFCVCPRCRKWDADPNVRQSEASKVEDGSEVDRQGMQPDNSPLPESLSNRYARWYNELAVRVRQIDPDSRIVAYAYGQYRQPPDKIQRIEPNVWIGYIGFNAYPAASDYRRASMDEWLGWSRRGATVFLRSNSLFYLGEGAPLVTSHQLAEDFRFQVANGLRATDFDCLQGYWATTGPSYYLLARLLWDTDEDPDQILDEFYGAFGPMAPVVKEYFADWEDYSTRLGDNPEYARLNRTDRLKAYPTFYTDAVLAGARKVLDKARPLLDKATPEERERFQNIELGLEHGQLLVKALRDGKTSNGSEGTALLDFRRQIASRNVINVYWTTSKEIRYRVCE
jgi:hypothetical protein